MEFAGQGVLLPFRSNLHQALKLFQNPMLNLRDPQPLPKAPIPRHHLLHNPIRVLDLRQRLHIALSMAHSQVLYSQRYTTVLSREGHQSIALKCPTVDVADR